MGGCVGWLEKDTGLYGLLGLHFLRTARKIGKNGGIARSLSDCFLSCPFFAPDMLFAYRHQSGIQDSDLCHLRGIKKMAALPAGDFIRTGIGNLHYPFSLALIDTVNVFCRHHDPFPFSKGPRLCRCRLWSKNVLQFRYEIGHFHNTEYISFRFPCNSSH